ncbi:Interleukin-19 [Camelus dromedarius]|uniref:Interleukin-19 n=1 Tax=Camelus dromedarius TaxID=9838 RepID=A0A5N4CJA8_CAMDR|nr:Interleukin-19 [Camelus dromedarius]
MLFLCSVHTRDLRRCLISTDVHTIEESFRGIKKTIQAKDTFQNVTILSPSETLHSIKPSDVCCVTKNLLAFYMDRVFKDHLEPNPQILRKLSSIANSFLSMQKTLQQCVRHHNGIPSLCPLMGTVSNCSQQKQRLCHCGQEATNATRIIHDNYDQVRAGMRKGRFLGRFPWFQLEVRSAAIKSLGELDIFLAWIDKHHHGTSAAERQGT